MAGATYFKRCQRSFTLLHGPQRRRISFSLIIPNASTQGPPTSRAVQVNLENSTAVAGGFQPTEFEARLHPALTRIQHPSRLGVKADVRLGQCNQEERPDPPKRVEIVQYVLQMMRHGYVTNFDASTGNGAMWFWPNLILQSDTVCCCSGKLGMIRDDAKVINYCKSKSG